MAFQRKMTGHRIETKRKKNGPVAQLPVYRQVEIEQLINRDHKLCTTSMF